MLMRCGEEKSEALRSNTELGLNCIAGRKSVCMKSKVLIAVIATVMTRTAAKGKNGLV